MTKVGCAIPCYKGNARTLDVVKVALKQVDLVVLIDDQCPNKTGMALLEYLGEERNLKVIFNEYNVGVGGSTLAGFDYLIKHGCDIVVKVDADGQIDPKLINALILPIEKGISEAAKGNRFSRLDHVKSMPLIRILGNLGLSFLSKISTGYWELFDPTNGFIAFRASCLERVRLDKIDNRYFFESDMLFQCGLAQITYSQLSMLSTYGNEDSSLRPLIEASRFARKHIVNGFKRIIYQYYLLDFNAGSLELLLGISGLFLSAILVLKTFIAGYLYGKTASAGEAGLIVMTSIITVQLLISFVYYDTTVQPLMRRIKASEKIVIHDLAIQR